MFNQAHYAFDILRKFPTCMLTDYGHPVRKSPSLHGRKSNPNPKLLGTAEAYFISHIGPKSQISLIYAFIGCLLSVCMLIRNSLLFGTLEYSKKK